MREIKFRIWDTENKEMLKVQELDFEPTFFGGRIAIRPDQYSDYFDTEDMILMQYTGLKDKNGKEIYEGDIVQHLYEFSDVTDRYLIDYDEDDLSYVFQNISNKNRFIALEDLYDEDYGDYAIEVIGNIYENPELLERR